MNNPYNLNFGADPEFFVTYNDGTPKVISPALLMRDIGLQQIGGNIKHPEFIKTDEYKWIMDGVAFELTLMRPHKDPIEMWKTIHYALEHLDDFISHMEHPDFGKLSLYTKPVVDIDPSVYLSRIENDEQVHQGFIFGCDPDMDAIDPTYECVTIDVKNHTHRYAGGHIHLSGRDCLADFPLPAIKLLAITIGNFVTAHTPCPDLERKRVQTYGRPGRYRVQQYTKELFGIEYRTPSNQWTQFDASTIEQMFHWTSKVVRYLEEERVDIIKDFLSATVDAIVNVKPDLASSILMALP